MSYLRTHEGNDEDFKLNFNIIKFWYFRQLQSNGTIEFPAFASQFYRSDVHDQVYRCQASNQAGTIISKNVHVRGIVHEFYEVKVEGHEVLLNNVAFLKCVVPLHMREHVEITSWYRDEEVLTDNSDISKYSLLYPLQPKRKKVTSIIKTNLRQSSCSCMRENN